jgi:Fe-S-cluster-containing hydrogenase component 2
MDVCPNNAIVKGRNLFRINPRKCTDCEGLYEEAQCASICPVEGAILDQSGAVANPPGTLTGIPPERTQELIAQGVL